VRREPSLITRRETGFEGAGVVPGHRHAVRDLCRRDGAQCLALLSQWWWVDWNAARLVVDLVGVPVPAVYDLVTHLKLYLYGYARLGCGTCR
jgi:hypothetical protein